MFEKDDESEFDSEAKLPCLTSLFCESRIIFPKKRNCVSPKQRFETSRVATRMVQSAAQPPRIPSKRRSVVIQQVLASQHYVFSANSIHHFFERSVSFGDTVVYCCCTESISKVTPTCLTTVCSTAHAPGWEGEQCDTSGVPLLSDRQSRYRRMKTRVLRKRGAHGPVVPVVTFRTPVTGYSSDQKNREVMLAR